MAPFSVIVFGVVVWTIAVSGAKQLCFRLKTDLCGRGLNKERFQLAENLRSARCSPFVISKVLAARMRKLITARARKKKRTARILANARKDHSIPLILKALW